MEKISTQQLSEAGVNCFEVFDTATNVKAVINISGGGIQISSDGPFELDSGWTEYLNRIIQKDTFYRERRKSQGRYTLEEAGAFLFFASSASISEMEYKFRDAALADQIDMYEADSLENCISYIGAIDKNHHLYFDKCRAVDKNEYYWDDLNKWLEVNKPRITFRFKDPNDVAPEMVQELAAKDESATEQKDTYTPIEHAARWMANKIWPEENGAYAAQRLVAEGWRDFPDSSIALTTICKELQVDIPAGAIDPDGALSQQLRRVFHGETDARTIMAHREIPSCQAEIDALLRLKLLPFYKWPSRKPTMDMGIAWINCGELVDLLMAGAHLPGMQAVAKAVEAQEIAAEDEPETVENRRKRLLVWFEQEKEKGPHHGALARVIRREQVKRPSADKSSVREDMKKAREQRDGTPPVVNTNNGVWKGLG